MAFVADKAFSFLRFVDTSPAEAFTIAKSGLLRRWLICLLLRGAASKLETYYDVNDIRWGDKIMFHATT